MDTIKKTVSNHWIQLVGFVFVLGTTYSNFQMMQKDIEILDTRLEKKIKIINELEDRIIQLEKCK